MRWQLKAKSLRMLGYLLILLALAAWRFMPRPWHPTTTLKTPHHTIYSTARPEQTRATAHALERLYLAYSNRLGGIPGFQTAHPPLRVKLFKDRKEFRWVNPGLGWAEAFYRKPYCRAYYAANEKNPHHWMLHESVHQLNQEVAQLTMAQWLEEGLSEYFATSRLTTNALAVGCIDPNTYPIWWIDELATTPDLAENLRNGSVIPLRVILTHRGGPGMRQHFNLYYLHWWTLTHFLFEHPEYRGRALQLVERGGGLEAFEEIIGPVEQVQQEWHDHVRRVKAFLEGHDREFLRTGRIPQPESPDVETP